jgi:hypothetical protein
MSRSSIAARGKRALRSGYHVNLDVKRKYHMDP